MMTKSKKIPSKTEDLEREYLQAVRKHRKALRRAYLKKDKDAILKARELYPDNGLMSGLEPPDKPSVLFYPPPVTGDNDSEEGPQIYTPSGANDAYIDISEIVDSLPPPKPKKRYDELDGSYYEYHDPQFDQQIRCSHDSRWKSVSMLVSVNNFLMTDLPDPEVECGFETGVIVTDYLWEYVSIYSQLNSHLLSIQLDTHDQGHNESYAYVKVNHVVEFILRNRLKKRVTREIFSRSLATPEQEAIVHDLRIGTDISSTYRVFAATSDLTVREFVEIEVDSNAWVRVEGYFAWDPLKVWWTGATLLQNIGKAERESILEILTTKPVPR